jgi:hypothetical protein
VFLIRFFSTFFSYFLIATLLVIAGGVLPRVSQAYCVYNETSRVIRATNPDSCSGLLCGDFDVSIAPGSKACCNWAEAGCNSSGVPDHIWNIRMSSDAGGSAIANGSQLLPDSGFFCVTPIRADGYAIMREWDRSRLGVNQKALYCDGYEDFNPDRLRFRTPPGIYEENRDEHFQVSGDPQYWKDKA